MSAWHASVYTGLFTRFGKMSPRPHDPVTSLCSGEAVAWTGVNEPVTASGIGWDDASAEGACIGEAIERLQACPIPCDELVHASFDAWPLRERAIDPASWVLFHADQYRQPAFPFKPLTRESPCDWICFREALTGEPRWIPTELAYLHMPAGHCYCPGYSTGLASGRWGHPILLRGLQEVIERDAVLGAWWGRYSLDEIAVDAMLQTQTAEIRQRVLRPNLTYRCFRVATPFSDHVTMVTLKGDDREGYCFSIGSSCRETRAASWEKSLLEAIHGRHYVRYLKGRVAAGDMRVGRKPMSFADHAVFYSLYPDMLPETVLGKKSIPPHSRPNFADDQKEDIATLVAQLGPERPVLFRSMTPPALASEDLGWHVLRVVVPGLQPLHGRHDFAHLGGALWSPRGVAEYATMPPHPFP